MKTKIYTFALHRDGEVGVEAFDSVGHREQALREHCLDYFENAGEPDAGDWVTSDLVAAYEAATDCSILRGEDEVEVPVLDAVADHLHSIVKEIEWSRHYPSNYHVLERCLAEATAALNKLKS